MRLIASDIEVKRRARVSKDVKVEALCLKIGGRGVNFVPRAISEVSIKVRRARLENILVLQSDPLQHHRVSNSFSRLLALWEALYHFTAQCACND